MGPVTSSRTDRAPFGYLDKSQLQNLRQVLINQFKWLLLSPVVAAAKCCRVDP